MRNLFLITILAVAVSVGFSNISFAVCGGGPTVFTCDTNPPNPDLNGVQQDTNNADLTVNVLSGAGIDTSGSPSDPCIVTGNGNDDINVDNGDLKAINAPAIAPGDGDDRVTVDGGNIESNNAPAIAVSDDNDTVIVNAGNIIGGGIGISAGDNNDTVVINGGLVKGGTFGITLGDGDNNLTVNGGTLMSNNVATILLLAGDDKDIVTLNGGTYMPGSSVAVDLLEDNDTLTFGGDIELNGIVDCGEGFDTLIFAMDVPEELLSIISSEIAAAGLPDGSVTINGVFYEWIDCDLLVPDLNGVRNLRPIPTLSEWGLIAMAGVLGIMGLLVMRRRRISV